MTGRITPPTCPTPIGPVTAPSPPYRYNNYELPVADRDGDGIADGADRCPDQAGPGDSC